MGNLAVHRATARQIERKQNCNESFPVVALKLSELAMAKPTLKLDDDTHVYWAQKLSSDYELDDILMAIEQVIQSSVEFVNLGTIAEEARQVKAKRPTTVYSPFGDPKKLTVSQLRDAAFDGNESAAQLLKQQQSKALSVRDRSAQ